jgi:hypothetical protein
VLGRRGDREGGERSVLDIGQGLARRSRRREEKVWLWSRLGRKIAQHLNQILLCKNNSDLLGGLNFMPRYFFDFTDGQLIG